MVNWDLAFSDRRPVAQSLSNPLFQQDAHSRNPVAAASKSDSQQLSIMGFVLLDTPAALLVAFGREDPTV
jgi:hypothetical protein